MILIAALISTIIMFVRTSTHRIGWCLITFWISWLGYIEYCEYLDGRWLLTGVFMFISMYTMVTTAWNLKETKVQKEKVSYDVVDWKDLFEKKEH